MNVWERRAAALEAKVELRRIIGARDGETLHEAVLRVVAERDAARSLLREAFDTPWVGSDGAHVDEVTQTKRRIAELLGK